MEAPDQAGRFWAKVDKSAECWIWKGALADKSKKAPYGKFEKTRAHRLAYELTHGPINNGLHVLHKCDNTLCVNPSHLFLGTPKDNALDKTAKGRNNLLKGEEWQRAHAGKHSHCRLPAEAIRRGQDSHLAKLTDAQVIEIRLRWLAAKKKYGFQRQLAREYGVDRTLIWGITSGRIWRHLL